MIRATTARLAVVRPRRAHLIAEAHFAAGAGPCELTCECGAVLAAESPDELDELFWAHRHGRRRGA